MRLDQLRALARAALKGARIPERGQMYKKALSSPDHYGAAAHHAAHLLHDVGEIERHLAEGAVAHAIEQAVSAGRRAALLEATQPQSLPLDSADLQFMARAVERRDRETLALEAANADRAADIDVTTYDRLKAAGKTQEDIAEHFGCTRQALWNWRGRNGRRGT